MLDAKFCDNTVKPLVFGDRFITGTSNSGHFSDSRFRCMEKPIAMALAIPLPFFVRLRQPDDISLKKVGTCITSS